MTGLEVVAPKLTADCVYNLLGGEVVYGK